jgi:hypothetical protein
VARARGGADRPVAPWRDGRRAALIGARRRGAVRPRRAAGRRGALIGAGGVSRFGPGPYPRASQAARSPARVSCRSAFLLDDSLANTMGLSSRVEDGDPAENPREDRPGRRCAILGARFGSRPYSCADFRLSDPRAGSRPVTRRNLFAELSLSDKCLPARIRRHGTRGWLRRRAASSASPAPRRRRVSSRSARRRLRRRSPVRSGA